MSKRVKISKLCLQIDGKKIELTLKQAQELKDVLNDTFGEKVTEYIYPYRPYPYYPYSTWTVSSGTCDITSTGQLGTTTDTLYLSAQ